MEKLQILAGRKPSEHTLATIEGNNGMPRDRLQPWRRYCRGASTGFLGTYYYLIFRKL